ncbi:MAG: hypothetical protein ACRDLN_04440 [Solirubrobacteraceae bacterium]
MKRLTYMIAGVLLALALLASSGAFAGSAANARHVSHGAPDAYGFERFPDRYEAANSAFVDGEPQPWLSITAAQVDFEYLVKDVRGKLAHTVAIERADVLYAGHTEPRQQILRAT